MVGGISPIGKGRIKVGGSPTFVGELHRKMPKLSILTNINPGRNVLSLKRPDCAAAGIFTFPIEGRVILTVAGMDLILEPRAIKDDKSGKIRNLLALYSAKNPHRWSAIQNEPFILGENSDYSRMLKDFFPPNFPAEACIVSNEGKGSVRIESVGADVEITMIAKLNNFLSKKEREKIIAGNAKKLESWSDQLWGQFYVEVSTRGEFLSMQKKRPFEKQMKTPWIKVEREGDTRRVKVTNYLSTVKLIQGFDCGDIGRIEEQEQDLMNRLYELEQQSKIVKKRNAVEKRRKQLMAEKERISKGREDISKNKLQVLKLFEGTVELSKGRYNSSVATYDR